MKKTVVLLVMAWCLYGIGPAQSAENLIEHGRYVFNVAGCVSCHTSDQLMAGGRPVETPFGTFHPPNATPHRESGIGSWTEEDFVRALQEGLSPQGKHYYPAFPYTSYTRMTREDMRALYAYLMSLPESSREDRSHQLHWPFSYRPILSHWKAMRFSPGVYSPDPQKTPEWNRGAYLAEALGHCNECHTPRDFMSAPRRDRYLAGTCAGPDGRPVSNITPDRETGIGTWSYDGLATFLKTGRKPDGSYTSSLMAEVLGNSCMQLNGEDLHALVTYLQSVPPVHNDLDTRCASYDDSYMFE